MFIYYAPLGECRPPLRGPRRTPFPPKEVDLVSFYIRIYAPHDVDVTFFSMPRTITSENATRTLCVWGYAAEPLLEEYLEKANVCIGHHVVVPHHASDILGALI